MDFVENIIWYQLPQIISDRHLHAMNCRIQKMMSLDKIQAFCFANKKKYKIRMCCKHSDGFDFLPNADQFKHSYQTCEGNTVYYGNKCGDYLNIMFDQASLNIYESGTVEINSFSDDDVVTSRQASMGAIQLVKDIACKSIVAKKDVAFRPIHKSILEE